jgi:hypothetical protein
MSIVLFFQNNVVRGKEDSVGHPAVCFLGGDLMSSSAKHVDAITPIKTATAVEPALVCVKDQIDDILFIDDDLFFSTRVDFSIADMVITCRNAILTIIISKAGLVVKFFQVFCECS